MLQLPHLQPKLGAQGGRAHHLATSACGTAHQRRDAGQGELHGARVVRHRGTRWHGRFPSRPAHAGEPATRLRRAIQHGLVRIRAPGPKAIDMADHQPRMRRRQRLKVQRHAGERGGAVVAEKDIRTCQQPPHHRPAQFRVQVQNDGALALVHGEELRAQGIRRQRVVHAAVVAAQIAHGRFHLDDLRPHVGEVEAGGRPLDGRRQLHHLEARQWSRHSLPSPWHQGV